MESWGHLSRRHHVPPIQAHSAAGGRRPIAIVPRYSHLKWITAQVTSLADISPTKVRFGHICKEVLNMDRSGHQASLAPARWVGGRVMFEIEDNGQIIVCGISQEALQGFSQRRMYKGPDLLQCFATARDKIESIARRKWRLRPDDATGRVNIWADDVDDQPASPLAPDDASEHLRRA
jgi:hypothetical protein